MRWCEECLMVDGQVYLGAPVCMLYKENDYSAERKKELARKGCFKFTEK